MALHGFEGRFSDNRFLRFTRAICDTERIVDPLLSRFSTGGFTDV
jgi:hypothetical protein